MVQVPSYDIREYRQEDPLPAWANALLGSEVSDLWKDAMSITRIIAAMTDTGDVGGAILLLIEDDAQNSRQTTEGRPAQKVASIRQLIVKAEHRGRGLAGRLIRRAQAVAAQEKCLRIRSTAGWGCPDHLTMYDRLRFVRASSADRPYLVTRSLADAEL